MNLKYLQEQFVQALMTPNEISAFLNEVAPHPRLSATQRFNIYRNSILERLTKVLKHHYPVCLALIGDLCFQGVCRAYAFMFPNVPYDVNTFGEHFSLFLEKFEPLQDLVYLPDVAKLEWAIHKVLSGGKGEMLDITKLELVSPDNQGGLRFHLGSCTTLMFSQYPIYTIWQMNQPHYQGAESVSLDEGGCHIFIYRQGWQLRLVNLTEEEFLFLSYFHEGLTFEEVCQKCDSIHPHLDIPTLFSKALTQGWLSDFY
jgi:hypothetical protein